MATVQESFFTWIIDLSHHEDYTIDFGAYRAAGGVAVIHKATEGLDFRDPRFVKRKTAAMAVGLLWGSFHFSGNVNDDGTKQADYYLAHSNPGPNELISFDCEKHGTLANMEKFVLRIQEKLGRLPMIYGRNLLPDLMSNAQHSIVTQCALWYN